MNFLVDFFANNFSSCVFLAAIFIAFIPTLESKIAIPFAMDAAIWGANALPAWQAFIFAYLGSILPCFLIIFVTRKLKTRTTGFVIDKFRKKYSIKTTILENEKSIFKKYLMLATFVALPLPLTGVWSGSILAGFSDLKLSGCFLSIGIGAFLSCFIVTLLCSIFENSIGFILFFSLLIIILFLIFELIFDVFKSHKKRT